MFYSQITNNNINTTDLKTSVETYRQTRPFEIVRYGSSTHITITPGYKGSTIYKDSYYFPYRPFDADVQVQQGDRLLLYGQDDQIENGIWSILSIVNGYFNIQRPQDYAKSTPIRSGQYVLVNEGIIGGIIFKNITPEYDGNNNKIINYNGTSPQNWEPFKRIYYFP